MTRWTGVGAKWVLSGLVAAAALFSVAPDAEAVPRRVDRRIHQLAIEVEHEARHVHDMAIREATGRYYRAREAVVALRRFEAAAMDFRRVVQLRRGRAGTQASFVRLQRQFRHAENAVYHAYFSRHFMRDFYRLSDAVGTLERVYNRPGNRPRPRPEPPRRRPPRR